MRAAPAPAVLHFRACEGLRALGQLARRGAASRPVEPARRRLVLLQIDGLSASRLREALARGNMPHLKRALDERRFCLRTIYAASAPSTPVFQAGLLYGVRGDLPGFGWFDRQLGRTVRMDLADDVVALEGALHQAAQAPSLLDGGVSYGTIWPGGADEAFFNIVLFVHGVARAHAAAGGVRARARNIYDRLVSLVGVAAITGRVASRFVLEMAVGAWDFARWCRRIRSTRFEWRFLYMRLFVSVVMREMAAEGTLLDVLRGVPIVYVDFLGYDEYAHRRGPDAELALYNLRGIDAAIGKIVRATEAVPEYGYDVYVFSDHGQSATTPFERVVGRDLHAFVLEHAAQTAVGPPVESQVVTKLVELRSAEFFVRTLWRPVRPFARLYVEWLRRRLARRLDDQARAPLDAIEVVTGGSIAQLYFGRQPGKLTVEQIARRWPALLEALIRSPAIGLMVGCAAAGPVVFHRGERCSLDDRARLGELEPFRRVGRELLRRHLIDAARGERSGDLVLYGAFAEAGSVSFDFEFGSHGGVGPEELEQFVLFPAAVDFPLDGAVAAEEFYRFFRAIYAASDEPGERDAA
jgi:hypothetical protein